MLLYFFYLFLSPIIWLIIIISSIFNLKIRSNYFSFRNQLQSIKQFLITNKKNKKVYLFHAASSGEFEQLIPILRLINRKEYIIIQSFTSPTIFNKVNNSDLFDMACYQPFDLFWLSYLFFKTIQPEKYIITRHDIWPNHIVIAKALGIKIYFINANMHTNTIWYKKIFISLTKFLFYKISHIHFPSDEILKNMIIKKIYHQSISVSPDSRIEQVLYRSKNNSLILPSAINKNNTTIFGSIDKYDEEIIFTAIGKQYPLGDIDLQDNHEYLIFVPHETNSYNINRVIKKLNYNNFKKITFMDNLHEDSLHNIIIVDQVGFLADLYKYTSKAYVGGGFSRGVHSILEPAVYNCNIAFGPNIEMLNEAKDLVNNNHTNIIKTTNDMYKFLKSENKEISLGFFNNNNISQTILNKILA